MTCSKTIIGNDPALKVILQSIKKVAPTGVTVLITGETGTGKELVANAILKNSPRKNKVFIPLNCAALPESLIESELFGYCKGAFTGAKTHKQGILATVDGGTLFLDEINSLSLPVQIKLLRFLEAGEYMPIGSIKAHKADIRIIAASNTDLEQQVELGAFRKDLYFRLNIVPLMLPPLRERPQDIELLINHFMDYFAKKYTIKAPLISAQALTKLQSYFWPGNIRELRNLCENLTIFSLNRPIDVADLPRDYLQTRKTEFERLFELPEQGLNWPEQELNLIRQAIIKSNGNCQQASLLLGMSRDTLYYRAKKGGLI